MRGSFEGGRYVEISVLACWVSCFLLVKVIAT
jgi:hypothetical protein